MAALYCHGLVVKNTFFDVQGQGGVWPRRPRASSVPTCRQDAKPNTSAKEREQEQLAVVGAAEAGARAWRVLSVDSRFGGVAALLFADRGARGAVLALEAARDLQPRAVPAEHAIRDVLAWRCQAECSAFGGREQFMTVATRAGVRWGNDMAQLLHSHKKVVSALSPVGWLSVNGARNARRGAPRPRRRR